MDTIKSNEYKQLLEQLHNDLVEINNHNQISAIAETIKVNFEEAIGLILDYRLKLIHHTDHDVEIIDRLQMYVNQFTNVIYALELLQTHMDVTERLIEEKL